MITAASLARAIAAMQQAEASLNVLNNEQYAIYRNLITSRLELLSALASVKVTVSTTTESNP